MQVRTIDVLPSILELMSVEPREEVMGRSLLPFVRGGTKGRGSPGTLLLIRAGREATSSLRMGSRKLIVTATSAPRDDDRLESNTTI